MQSYRELLELIESMDLDDSDFELPSFFSMPKPPPPIFQGVSYTPPAPRTPFSPQLADKPLPSPPSDDDTKEEPSSQENEQAAQQHPNDEYIIEPAPEYQKGWDDDMSALEQAKEPVAVAPPPAPSPSLDLPTGSAYQPDDWADGNPESEPDDSNDPEPESALPEFDESGWSDAGSIDGLPPLDAPPHISKKRRVIALIANAMVFVVFFTILAGVLAFVFANDSDRAIFGYRMFHVASDSMAPVPQPDGTLLPDGFRRHDAIIVRIADAHQVQVGDIVTLCRGETQYPLTHRVTYVLDNFYDETGIGFITRGDGNSYSDPPSGGSQLLGIKVASIPRIGHVFYFAQNRVALTIFLCTGLMVGVFVLFIMSLRKPSEPDETNKPSRRRKKPEEAPAPAPASEPLLAEPWDIQADNHTATNDWTAHPVFAHRR